MTLQHYRGTLAALSSAMGFSDPSAHWGEIPDDYQPPEAPPDPKIAAEEAKRELERAKLAMSQEAAQAKNANALEALRLKAMETEAKHSRELQQMEQKWRLEQERMNRETSLALQELRAEIVLNREKMAADAERRDADRRQKVEISNNRPGGKLDA